MIHLIVFVSVPLVLFGLIIGRTTAKRHLRYLDQQEQERQGFLVTQVKSFADPASDGPPPTLIVAEVVIGSDHLKTFLAGRRALFGGEMKSLTRITERAKREAIVRLVQQSTAVGYNALCNVRVTPASAAVRSGRTHPRYRSRDRTTPSRSSGGFVPGGNRETGGPNGCMGRAGSPMAADRIARR